MCIARGRFDPAVTEEPVDNGQAFAERQRQRPGSESMTQMVDPGGRQTGPRR